MLQFDLFHFLCLVNLVWFYEECCGMILKPKILVMNWPNSKLHLMDWVVVATLCGPFTQIESTIWVPPRPLCSELDEVLASSLPPLAMFFPQCDTSSPTLISIFKNKKLSKKNSILTEVRSLLDFWMSGIFLCMKNSLSATLLLICFSGLGLFCSSILSGIDLDLWRKLLKTLFYSMAGV